MSRGNSRLAHPVQPGSAVVITGASTGIGRASALTLHEVGFHVFAGVRRTEDGDALLAAISSTGRGQLTPVLIDVTDEDSIRKAFSTVADEVGEHGLSGLVNNAGIGIPGPLEYLPLPEFRRQLEVNLVGPVVLIQEFLPLLRNARGRIVNVSSVAGQLATVPFNGAYAAAKHGLEAISDTLRSELRQWGIEVSVIQPGAISTAMPDTFLHTAESILDGLPAEGHDRYGTAMRSFARRITDHCRDDGTPPEVVARAVLHALTARSPRTRYPIGAQAGRALFMRRLLPDRLLERAALRMLRLE